MNNFQNLPLSSTVFGLLNGKVTVVSAVSRGAGAEDGLWFEVADMLVLRINCVTDGVSVGFEASSNLNCKINV